jgi:8-hydroxy-5-deazaflavin:NADPH oxidoreductase
MRVLAPQLCERERSREPDLPDEVLPLLCERRAADGGRRRLSLCARRTCQRENCPRYYRLDGEADQPHRVPTIHSRAVPEPVCIVGGTGALGFGLALRLGREGVPIVVGSRDAERAEEAARRAEGLVPDGSFRGLHNTDAVQQAQVVILSVPFRSQSETLTNLKTALAADQLLVDATVPLAAAVSGKATRTLGVWQGSAAQQAQEMAPEGVRIVSAFHSLSAALLADLEHEMDEDVLICGDRREDKARLAGLVELIPGLRAVDCGRLEMARIVEQLTALLISINVRNKVRAGIRITGLDKTQ